MAPSVGDKNKQSRLRLRTTTSDTWTANALKWIYQEYNVFLSNQCDYSNPLRAVLTCRAMIYIRLSDCNPWF